MTTSYAANILKTNGIAHGFFTRIGGVSAGVYEGLNCGPGSGDDPAHIQANREKARKVLGADHLLSLYQIHSADCITIDQPWGEDRPQGDAFVTDQPGIALGILTADCTPVLFVGHKADGTPVIGAAHAGWKGAIGGVLASTVQAMQDLGADTIKAAIGPCIGKKSYEVDHGFAERFIEQDEANEHFFSAAQREGHAMFDLEGYCAAQLAASGLRDVELLGLDTYTREQEFYSYRRKTHRDEVDYGRQISAIVIAP